MRDQRAFFAADFLPENASETLYHMAQAACLAGQDLLAASSRRSELKITHKTAGDFVSEADLAAEKAIFEYLKSHFPTYGWLGEETGEHESDPAELRWIVDPLDGTTNFLKGLPHWAVSIALCNGETPIAAVIFDPVKKELFAAERGTGAFLNGDVIMVSDENSCETALLATGLPAGGRVTYLPHSLQDIQATMPATAGLRRWGAAALDLAYVAAGRLDVYWERNLGAWDIAAGILIVQEAGGRVTPLWVDTSILSSGSFIASNGILHDAVGAFLNTEK